MAVTKSQYTARNERKGETVRPLRQTHNLSFWPTNTRATDQNAMDVHHWAFVAQHLDASSLAALMSVCRVLFHDLPWLLPKHALERQLNCTLKQFSWDRPMQAGSAAPPIHDTTTTSRQHTPAVAAGGDPDILLLEFNLERFFVYSWLGAHWDAGSVRDLAAAASGERFGRCVMLQWHVSRDPYHAPFGRCYRLRIVASPKQVPPAHLEPFHKHPPTCALDIKCDPHHPLLQESIEGLLQQCLSAHALQLHSLEAQLEDEQWLLLSRALEQRRNAGLPRLSRLECTTNAASIPPLCHVDSLSIIAQSATRLGPFADINVISLSQLDRIGRILGCHNVDTFAVELYGDDVDSPIDLTGLEGIPSVTFSVMQDSCSADLMPLAHATQTVELSHLHVPNLAPLANAASVCLHACDGFADTRPLAAATTVEVSHNDSLSGIVTLPSATSLKLQYCPHVTGMLMQTSGPVTELQLTSCLQLTMLPQLAPATLQRVELRSLAITDLAPVANATHITVTGCNELNLTKTTAQTLPLTFARSVHIGSIQHLRRLPHMPRVWDLSLASVPSCCYLDQDDASGNHANDSGSTAHAVDVATGDNDGDGIADGGVALHVHSTEQEPALSSRFKRRQQDLKHLRSLKLHDTPFPPFELPQLQKLVLRGDVLPSSFALMPRARDVTISCSFGRTTLPLLPDLGVLSHLQSLSLSNVDVGSACSLRHLKKVKLVKCVGKCERIEDVSEVLIRGCAGLTVDRLADAHKAAIWDAPAAVGVIQHIHTLTFTYVNELRCGSVSNVQRVIFDACTRLKALPPLGPDIDTVQFKRQTPTTLGGVENVRRVLSPSDQDTFP
ncbi:hypothetical protein PTSG_12545 [Salpingoeca rosetta]|uniref:Uncharacterized protein n=1 Tax=Salpingoeca rosetta (strain ATCC 50818 / BSB-021) TaxID=946362 RepID=F2UEB5_SALR5|nr:uncharacterized protein PTSG_12545 [Salpingoeca rosetta]EGD74965.1 hypothetical protein PTSG_12545 [Salpingoeca rosetta]|eukprot:XP_004992610.1 hypothetical protein PTSG_12545 [Salpingoeca rosetta]